MNEKMFIRIISSAGMLSFALGGLVTINGCTSPEDPPMPPGIYVPKKAPVASNETEVSKNDPEITDPVIANVAPATVIAPPAAPQKPAKEQVYNVVKGDSLWSISRKHGLKIEELALYNNMSANTKLRIGQKLLIPPAGKVTAPSANAGKNSNAIRSSKHVKSSKKSAAQTKKNTVKKAAAAAVTAEGVYVVKAGDNFSTIAKRNGIKVADIIAANPGVSSNKLQVGQKLNIKAGAAGASAPAKAEKALTTKSPATTDENKAPAAAKKEASNTDNLDQLLQDIKDPDQGAAKTENVPVATQKAVETVAAPASNDSADFSEKDKFEDRPDHTVVVTLGADTELSKFCQKYQLKDGDLKMLNPSIPADGKLKKGMVIKLP